MAAIRKRIGRSPKAFIKRLKRAGKGGGGGKGTYRRTGRRRR